MGYDWIPAGVPNQVEDKFTLVKTGAGMTERYNGVRNGFTGDRAYGKRGRGVFGGFGIGASAGVENCAESGR